MTQCQRILETMETRGSITSMEAFEMGITRLSARIYELRKMGILIVSDTVKSKNKYGEDIHFARYKKAV